MVVVDTSGLFDPKCSLMMNLMSSKVACENFIKQPLSKPKKKTHRVVPFHNRDAKILHLLIPLGMRFPRFLLLHTTLLKVLLNGPVDSSWFHTQAFTNQVVVSPSFIGFDYRLNGSNFWGHFPLRSKRKRAEFLFFTFETQATNEDKGTKIITRKVSDFKIA